MKNEIQYKRFIMVLFFALVKIRTSNENEE
jgi:hypothetical protein